MRQDNQIFTDYQKGRVRETRLVVKLGFNTPVYLTSHSDIPGIPGLAVDTITSVLKNVSGLTQNLKLGDSISSTIGRLSFAAFDKNGEVTDAIRTRSDSGEGINNIDVTVYHHGRSVDFSEFVPEMTQQIKGTYSVSRNVYKFSCSDVTNNFTQKIFAKAKTTTSGDFLMSDTTLPVFTTEGFEPCDHNAAFTESPTGSLYYLMVKYKNNFEVVRADSKTANSFNVTGRGLFGTESLDHVFPAGADSDSSIEVIEYPYLQGPGPALIYAILTGTFIGGGTCPWNLGLDPSRLVLESFTDYGTDVFDPNDLAVGKKWRFQNEKEQSAKLFIERQIQRLTGCFLVVDGDGRLRLKRVSQITPTADYVTILDSSNISKKAKTALTHDNGNLANVFTVSWAKAHIPGESKPRYLRSKIFVDAISINRNRVTVTKSMSFDGLHPDEHTVTTIAGQINVLRDLTANTISTATVPLMPGESSIEVGDVVRIIDPTVRDSEGVNPTLDRSMMVVNKSIAENMGIVTVRLMGTNRRASPLSDSDTLSTGELPDGRYDPVINGGVDLNSVATISGGVLQADATIGTSDGTRRDYYYDDGDLIIPSSRTLAFRGNVTLWVLGNLSINGTLSSIAGKPASVAGFIGHTMGGGSTAVGPSNGELAPAPPETITGTHDSLPNILIDNDGGDITGIPDDMRASGGGEGGGVVEVDPEGFWQVKAFGGAGGAGGGSLVTISRGCTVGPGGKVVLSGSPGSLGTIYNSGMDTYYAGTGGGGAPGSWLCLVDGNQNSVPIITPGVVEARFGDSPEQGGQANTPGKPYGEVVDLDDANVRVQFVPESRVPYSDIFYPEQAGSGGNSAEIEYSQDGLTNWHTVADPELDMYIRFRVEGGPWSGAFLISGPAGIDGIDGSDGIDGTDGINGIDGAPGKKNFADSSTWLEGVGSTPGVYGNFIQYGTENTRYQGFDAYGRPALIWEGRNTAGLQDGGWGSMDFSEVDPLKNHMSFVFFRRTSTPNAGLFYHGCHPSHTDSMGAGNPANPYFASAIPITNFPLDVWCVSIGYIFSSSHPQASQVGNGGIWRLDTQEKIFGNVDFKMKAGSTTQRHRSFMGSANQPGESMEFWYPGFYAMDGSEPSPITLITSAPELNGVVVSPDGVSYVQDPNDGDWTPPEAERLVDGVFFRGGVEVARRQIEITRQANGNVFVSDINVSSSGESVALASTGAGKRMVVTFTHAGTGKTAVEEFFTVQGGDGAVSYELIADPSPIIKNGQGTINVTANIVSPAGTITPITSGPLKIYDINNTDLGYSPSFTGATIVGKKDLFLKDGPTGNVYETIGLLDSLDGAPGEDGLPGQNGTDGQDGTDGSDGSDGSDAVFLIISPETANFTDVTGTTNYDNAQGLAQVYVGNVASNTGVTYSVVADPNTTMQINNTVNQFFVGPKGAFRITDVVGQQGGGIVRAVRNSITYEKTFRVTQLQPPIASAVSRDSLGGQRVGAGTVTTSEQSNCTVAGGVPPHSLLWEFFSGDPSIVLSTPATNSAAGFTTTLANNELKTAVYKCKITDSGSLVEYSQGVAISLSSFS